MSREGEMQGSLQMNYFVPYKNKDSAGKRLCNNCKIIWFKVND